MIPIKPNPQKTAHGDDTTDPLKKEAQATTPLQLYQMLPDDLGAYILRDAELVEAKGWDIFERER